MSALWVGLVAWLVARPVSTLDTMTETVTERRARLETVATAIVEASGGDVGKASFLAAQGDAESGWRLDVSKCRCRQNECDRGKARGYWQVHRAPETPDVWSGVCAADVESMTLAARWVLRRYRATSLECSFASLGGARVSCGAQWAMDRAKVARRLAVKFNGGE